MSNRDRRNRGKGRNGNQDGKRRERFSDQDNNSQNNQDVEVNELLVFGKNAVLESLKSGHSIDKVFVTKSGHVEGSLQKIVDEAKGHGVVVKFVEKEKLDSITNHGKHQGVAAYLAAQDYVELPELFARAEAEGESPFFIILDGIEDPHNLGAIIRTANVVGAHGVIIPKNRAVSLTATVAKTSAGAIAYTPVCKVTNLARTIEELQSKGVWITGADMDGSPMYDVDFKGAIGLVIGSEGKGISRLVRERCDFIASIPMKGDVNSLNASVAAGVLMYEAMRQRI